MTEHLPEHFGYEVAKEFTGLPKGPLYSLVSQRRIPHIRLGNRLVRFSREALKAWMDQHQIQSAAK